MQHYVVPSIYQDISNQYQGYFAFRFTCQQCSWSVDTRPIRSTVSTVTDVMDMGVGLLGGFLGRAAEMGEKIYGSQWHTEQAEALQKSWAQIQEQFRFCPKCHRTVCLRCFNTRLNLCTGSGCAPDLKADGSSFQHDLNVEAQRQQIQQNYQAPQFNVSDIPSAVTPDMVKPQAPLFRPQQLGAATPNLGPAAPGSSRVIACPTCHRMGLPGKFCQDCGTKLPAIDLFCPQCAAPVEASARFCSECGSKLPIP